jgi:hypothetical protein
MNSLVVDKTPHNWLNNIDALFEAQTSWKDGSYREEVFAQYYVDTNTPFIICCGVGILAAHVRKFKFNPKVIATLGRIVDDNSRPVFEESFLNHLQRLALRVELNMPLEGMFLFPDQPIAIIRGNKLQVLLLQSALRELVATSTYWATQAAFERWKEGNLVEGDTPSAPILPPNRHGWQLRARYIGGETQLKLNPESLSVATDLRMYSLEERNQVLGQIRRLFNGNLPLADVMMTEQEDLRSSVSKTDILIHNQELGRKRLEYTRFVKIYQPVLVKGHPVLASPQLAMRRQRTLHQLQSFSGQNLSLWFRGKEVTE